MFVDMDFRAGDIITEYDGQVSGERQREETETQREIERQTYHMEYVRM